MARIRNPDNPAPRFWTKVFPTDGCWIWIGERTGRGYGAFGLSRPIRKRTAAHRWVYEEVVGPIPNGKQIDHLCRNRLCVHPGHLEAVTVRENILRGNGLPARNARKTHCPRGHSLSGDNLYLADGSRYCRICIKTKSLARSRRQSLHPNVFVEQAYRKRARLIGNTSSPPIPGPPTKPSE